MAQTIPILVFFFVVLVCVGGYFFYQDHKAIKKEVLMKRVTTKISLKETRRLDLRRKREKSRMERVFAGVIDTPQLADLLSQSGINRSLDSFLFMSIGSAALFSLLAILLFRTFLPFLSMAGAGFFLPMLFLMYKKKQRDGALVKQLPDALEFMARALRSGQSLDKALYGVSTSFADPVGGEIKIIYEEISMGLAFADALKNFKIRFPKLPEVRFLCTCFIIQKETGGNLTDVLDGLSHTIRQRFKLARQVKAATAEARLSILFLGFAPFGFGSAVYMMKPAYVSVLFNEPSGQKLLFLALALNVTGFLVMKILSKVEV